MAQVDTLASEGAEMAYHRMGAGDCRGCGCLASGATRRRRCDTFIEVWGTGSTSREFLYVDDAATGIVLAAERYDGRDPMNLGVGSEITIRDLTELVPGLTGFVGEIRWDP